MAEIMFAMMGADIPALTVEKDLCVNTSMNIQL